MLSLGHLLFMKSTMGSLPCGSGGNPHTPSHPVCRTPCQPRVIASSSSLRYQCKTLADDLKIHACMKRTRLSETPVISHQCVWDDINKLHDTALSWGLHMNVSKCAVLSFHGSWDDDIDILSKLTKNSWGWFSQRLRCSSWYQFEISHPHPHCPPKGQWSCSEPS